MDYTVYTDASHVAHRNIAAAGWIILIGWREVCFQAHLLDGVTSSQAEAYAVSESLQWCFLRDDCSSVTIYTDL
jgi:ribonuclease HI